MNSFYTFKYDNILPRSSAPNGQIMIKLGTLIQYTSILKITNLCLTSLMMSCTNSENFGFWSLKNYRRIKNTTNYTNLLYFFFNFRTLFRILYKKLKLLFNWVFNISVYPSKPPCKVIHLEKS